MPTRASDHDSLPSLLQRTYISNASLVRNFSESEAIHRNALAVAQAEHQRVRESALRAYDNNELKVARDKLFRLQMQETERINLEAERAALATKVQDLQRKTIPIPPPRESTPPLPPTPKPTEISEEASTKNKNGYNPPTTPRTSESSQPSHSVTLPHPGLNVENSVPKITPTLPIDLQTQSNYSSQDPQTETVISPPSHPPTSRQSAPPDGAPTYNTFESVYPGVDEYVVIHTRLKQLRAFTMDVTKNNLVLKKKVGEMRREIRKSIGQLTEGKGANKTPMGAIVGLLKEALYNITSPPVDPGIFMLSTPGPAENAIHNGDTLPLLFIYLLNMFSKAIVAQLVDEAGVSPKFADPIGVVAVSTFAQPEFCWRGKSLIDILVCKFRVICPVLFGIRGNEQTEEGRKRVGWWRSDGGEWVSDQVHNVRMTGLGAGYAAISLRDFSKSKNQNPYPPTRYWQSMAVIVNTPPEQTSSTQYIVLKAMIDNFEQRLLTFYGSAAKAALRIAVVDFPNRAIEKNVAVASLKVLADKFKRDMGLQL